MRYLRNAVPKAFPTKGVHLADESGPLIANVLRIEWRAATFRRHIRASAKSEERCRRAADDRDELFGTPCGARRVPLGDGCPVVAEELSSGVGVPERRSDRLD